MPPYMAYTPMITVASGARFPPFTVACLKGISEMLSEHTRQKDCRIGWLVTRWRSLKMAVSINFLERPHPEYPGVSFSLSLSLSN